MEELSRTDDLTGLPNRRALWERIGQEKSRFERTGRPFSLILADLNDFKRLNDRHGHDCGDFVLASVAGIIRACLREQDLAGRWGGTEAPT